MFFSYLYAVGAEGQAWLSKTVIVLDVLSYLESVIGPTMIVHEKTLKTKVLRWLENAILIMVFANTILHNRANLLVL